MLYIVTDVEANGPHPMDYSMIEIGAVAVARNDHGQFVPVDSFFAQMMPLYTGYDPKALAAIGRTHEETTSYPLTVHGVTDYYNWVVNLTEKYGVKRPLFVADNAGFDWQFVNSYLWAFMGDNPFGWSPFSLTSFYKGVSQSMKASFRKYRITKHSHNALDDARGNAEALCAILSQHNIIGS